MSALSWRATSPEQALDGGADVQAGPFLEGRDVRPDDADEADSHAVDLDDVVSGENRLIVLLAEQVGGDHLDLAALREPPAGGRGERRLGVAAVGDGIAHRVECLVEGIVHRVGLLVVDGDGVAERRRSGGRAAGRSSPCRARRGGRCRRAGHRLLTRDGEEAPLDVAGVEERDGEGIRGRAEDGARQVGAVAAVAVAPEVNADGGGHDDRMKGARERARREGWFACSHFLAIGITS